MISVAITVALLVMAYFWGGAIEHNHLKDLVRRENAARGMPTMNFRKAPPGWEVVEGQMVTGSVVVSIDYFKRFVAGWKMFFGGRLKTLEPLLERARREAIQRMREKAHTLGYDAIINVRIETAPLASMSGGDGTGGVEMLAYGTAIKLANRRGQDPTH